MITRIIKTVAVIIILIITVQDISILGNERKPMKIYIVCDLEGVAGVIDHKQQCSWNVSEDWYAGYLDQARRLATLELNALVEGALEAGATEIVAWDGHGMFPGCIDIELLHPECKLIMGAGDRGPVGLDSTFDGLFQLGLHAMKNTEKAVLCHGGWKLNDRAIGEIGMNCLIAGYYDIPCLLVCGDKAAAEEAAALVPGIETAVVKEALFDDVRGLRQAPALTLSPAKAREIIRETARKAITKIGKIRPVCFRPPYRLQWEFSQAGYADDFAASNPEAVRIDSLTVELRNRDLMKLVE